MNQLRRLRDEADISRYRLAKESGLSESALYQIESGRRKGGGKVYAAIAPILAARLEISAAEVLAQLFELEEEPATAMAG